MKNNVKFNLVHQFFLVLMVLIFAIVGCCLNAHTITGAQTVGDVFKWPPPVRISQSGGFAILPFIVADKTGALHLVWSENVTNPTDEFHLDTIFYTRMADNHWSPPVDIFAAPTGKQALVNRLRIDDQGYLHILWVSRPGIVYASAPSASAASAQDWRAVLLPENAWIADFALDSNGVVHLVYILERQGVYYVRSMDGGNTWTQPAPIWLTPNNEYSNSSVRIEVDGQGILHVAWGTTAAANRWNPVGIGYARSLDDGQTWENTLEVSEGDNLPNIGFDRDGGVHLIWDNPASSNVGRGHAWSRDHGKTWQVERIFPGYRGQTWWPVMAQDSAGILHLIFAANPPRSGQSQVFHSFWQVGRWSTPQVISSDLHGTEGPSIAISEGNRLHVAWFSFNPKQYGIWLTSAESSAPWIPPEAIMGIQSDPTAISTNTPTPMPTPSPALTVTSQKTNGNFAQSESVRARPPWWSVGMGVLPALVLVLFVSFIWMTKIRS